MKLLVTIGIAGMVFLSGCTVSLNEKEIKTGNEFASKARKEAKKAARKAKKYDIPDNPKEAKRDFKKNKKKTKKTIRKGRNKTANGLDGLSETVRP